MLDGTAIRRNLNDVRKGQSVACKHRFHRLSFHLHCRLRVTRAVHKPLLKDQGRLTERSKLGRASGPVAETAGDTEASACNCTPKLLPGDEGSSGTRCCAQPKQPAVSLKDWSYEQSVTNMLRVQVRIGELEVTMQIDHVVLRSRR